jgi:hypothetical protein
LNANSRLSAEIHPSLVNTRGAVILMPGHKEVEQANRDWETFSAYDGTTSVPFRQ